KAMRRSLLLIACLVMIGCRTESPRPGEIAGVGALHDRGTGESLLCHVPVRLSDDRLVDVIGMPWACKDDWSGTKVIVSKCHSCRYWSVE
ncbi:MAG: hypothetical protein KY432_07360, partial [Acidobacteria bacterium]|nr:hypothetical protein [Acidobacteriota bacterium]